MQTLPGNQRRATHNRRVVRPLVDLPIGEDGAEREVLAGVLCREARSGSSACEVGGGSCPNPRRRWDGSWGGGELVGDAGPSRDQELQSDAAFGAVVTPVWVPAPGYPEHGGLASGLGKAEQVFESLSSVWWCTRGENQKEEETVRIGPGVMASKEEQVVENTNMENANQENGKKDEKMQDANKVEPLARPLKAGEYCVPRGNLRQLLVRQPILQYRWDVIQRLGEPQARMGEENMERIGEEMRQLMQKLREKQLSYSLRAVSTDPPHHDHHDEFCLMP